MRDVEWPFLLEPTICDFSCNGTRLRAAFRNHGLLRTMEVPMTMHGDHHITDTEDVAFDATMKVVGALIGVVVIAALALWYIYS
jgi:hypothetical protein